MVPDSGLGWLAQRISFITSTERDTTRAEDAQETPTQSHLSPSILVYEEERRKRVSYRRSKQQRKSRRWKDPPWRQPRGKSMVSLVNSHTNATSKRWHLWEIDLRFSPGFPPGWSGNGRKTWLTPERAAEQLGFHDSSGSSEQ